MVFHCRYSTLESVCSMCSTAKSKTVNGFSISIFNNQWCVYCFHQQKYNCQCVLNIDIKQRVFVFKCVQEQKIKRSTVFHYRYSKTKSVLMLSTTTNKTVNGFSTSIFKNLRHCNVFNSNKQNG